MLDFRFFSHEMVHAFKECLRHIDLPELIGFGQLVQVAVMLPKAVVFLQWSQEFHAGQFFFPLDQFIKVEPALIHLPLDIFF